MIQQVDASGQHMEAVSPLNSSPQSFPQRYVSQRSEMIDNSSPMPVEYTHSFSGYHQYKQYQPDAYAYLSAPEAVDSYPHQQFGHHASESPRPQYMHPDGAEKDTKQPFANESVVIQLKEEPRILGMRRRSFWVVVFVVAALVLLTVGLTVGLCIGLKKKNESDNVIPDPFCKEQPDLCIGGALDSKYYSTRGAFNGSGIALAGESWNNNVYRMFTIYYQHHKGDLRYMQYTKDRKWVGGTSSETIATDAKNGTAISAVAFTLNETAYNHIYYISKDNKVHQRILSNVTGLWENGPINDMNLKVFDSPIVGLQACYKGNYYGDSDYKKFPTADGKQNTVEFAGSTGINLWYPSDESTFEQYVWYSNANDTWVEVDPWTNKNVHAGVGCYSWGVGSTTYTMMVDDQNTTEIWWKDGDGTRPSTEVHPVNVWKNSSATIYNVDPATSLGYTNYLYMQMTDQTIKGFNVQFDAENTSIPNDDQFTIAPLGVNEKALKGTHLTATAVSVTETKDNETTTVWDSLYVFVQTVGNDITEFSRPVKGGEWSKALLTLTDD